MSVQANVISFIMKNSLMIYIYMVKQSVVDGMLFNMWSSILNIEGKTIGQGKIE